MVMVAESMKKKNLERAKQARRVKGVRALSLAETENLGGEYSCC